MYLFIYIYDISIGMYVYLCNDIHMKYAGNYRCIVILIDGDQIILH